MNVHLTEEIIHSRASDQSYQKGRDYYQSRAIYHTLQQPTAGGIVLTAQYEGSTEPYYRLRVELDAGGVCSASCTCPYDWGGDCKHIVALLLSDLQSQTNRNILQWVTRLGLSSLWKEMLDNVS